MNLVAQHGPRSMTGFGPLRKSTVLFRVRAMVAAKGCEGGAQRATEAVVAARRLPCGARVHGPAHNSLRSLRSLRSDRMRQVSLRSALRARAMNPALLGPCRPRRASRPGSSPGTNGPLDRLCPGSASHAHRAPPEHPFAAGSGGSPRPPPPVPERQGVPGGSAVCGAEQRSLEGGARSALRGLTCRILFERSERSERSELCGTPSRRAAQGSRCAAPTATVSAPAGHPLPRTAQDVERIKRTFGNVRNGPQADSLPARTMHASRIVQCAWEQLT